MYRDEKVLTLAEVESVIVAQGEELPEDYQSETVLWQVVHAALAELDALAKSRVED